MFVVLLLNSLDWLSLLDRMLPNELFFNNLADCTLFLGEYPLFSI